MRPFHHHLNPALLRAVHGSSLRNGWAARNKKSSHTEVRELLLSNNPGDTYFHAFGTIIGSQCLTAVFGMGTGVSTAIWSPGKDASGGKTACATQKVVA
jgi:hypothetical protein